MIRILTIVGLVLLGSGCAAGVASVTTAPAALLSAGGLVAYGNKENMIRTLNMQDKESFRGGPVTRGQEAYLYCYKTLATPDCYDQPQKGWENRFIAAAPRE